METAYVVRILVASGDPDGLRVVEKSNWTGEGVVFPRSTLPRAVEHGINGPGVYVLVGSDPDSPFEQQIHVGQSEDVGRRLEDHLHDDAMEFWDDTFVFVSTNGALNGSSILYLESLLVRLAVDAGQVRVANENEPESPMMSASDRAEADGFLAEMLAVFPLLGLRAFHRPATATPDAVRQHPSGPDAAGTGEERSDGSGAVRYHLSGPDAAGTGEERSDGFLVFAGATARVAEVASLDDSGRRLRRELVEAGVLMEEGGFYRLKSDHLFKSPSTAARVLLASNSNGRTAWKDDAGVTLKQRQTDPSSGGRTGRHPPSDGSEHSPLSSTERPTSLAPLDASQSTPEQPGESPVWAK